MQMRHILGAGYDVVIMCLAISPWDHVKPCNLEALRLLRDPDNVLGL